MRIFSCLVNDGAVEGKKVELLRNKLSFASLEKWEENILTFSFFFSLVLFSSPFFCLSKI